MSLARVADDLVYVDVVSCFSDNAVDARLVAVCGVVSSHRLMRTDATEYGSSEYQREEDDTNGVLIPIEDATKPEFQPEAKWHAAKRSTKGTPS